MARTDSISPFPADIDRDTFGHWLSGFTDGEAAFLLKSNLKGRTARFAITLRRDDRPILELIRSYWQCGQLLDTPNYGNRNGNPLTLFQVSSIKTLYRIVVPHFHRFPLHAKKRLDFTIWEQAVVLSWSIAKRPQRSLGVGRGTLPRWTEAERIQFDSIRAALASERIYKSATTPLPLV